MSSDASTGRGAPCSCPPIALPAGKIKPCTVASRMHEKQGACVLAIQYSLERTVTTPSSSGAGWVDWSTQLSLLNKEEFRFSTAISSLGCAQRQQWVIVTMHRER